MTNYERCTKEFKGNIIDFLSENTETCSDIRKMREGKCCEFRFEEQECRECEEANKRWLSKENHDFDFCELQSGDKFTAYHKAKEIRYSFDFLHMWMDKMWLIVYDTNGTYRDFVITADDMEFLFEDFELVEDDWSWS